MFLTIFNTKWIKMLHYSASSFYDNKHYECNQRHIQTQNDSGQLLWVPKKMSPKNDQWNFLFYKFLN